LKYPIFLSIQDKKQLEFEVVSQELRVHLTRLIERNDRFAKNDLINRNVLINRSRSLAGQTIYVLNADDWGDYEDCEYAWHFGEFELCLRRGGTIAFIELLCEVLERQWLNVDEVNSLLKQEEASFRFVQSGNNVSVDVFTLEKLEEESPLENEHGNIRLLVQRMNLALKGKDYSAVLHASASIFETLAKHIVGSSTVQNQTLGSFFTRYQKDSQLPADLQAKVLATYQARNSTPLAGHGSLQLPTITETEAVTLCELTKAFVRIEYTLQVQKNDNG
jgi:hypothetical protein